MAVPPCASAAKSAVKLTLLAAAVPAGLVLFVPMPLYAFPASLGLEEIFSFERPFRLERVFSFEGKKAGQFWPVGSMPIFAGATQTGDGEIATLYFRPSLLARFVRIFFKSFLYGLTLSRMLFFHVNKRLKASLLSFSRQAKKSQAHSQEKQAEPGSRSYPPTRLQTRRVAGVTRMQ